MINELIQQKNSHCVSIFLPTHVKGEDVQQDVIRLKNLIREAENVLIKKNCKSELIEGMLSDARKLLSDTRFWQYQKEGLALFINPDYFRVEKIPIRLKEHLYISDHFIITPILPMLVKDGHFFILALSQKEVRFYKANFEKIERLNPENVPVSLKDFLKYDDLQRQLQMRSATGDIMMFHGHGGGQDDTKKSINRFISAVESGITAFLNNEQAPLILAGVESVTSVYRANNNYKYLTEQEIRGNADIIKDTILLQKAQTIAESWFINDVYRDIQRFGELMGSDKCSTDISDIVMASEFGKIETLLLAEGTSKWGKYDKEKHEVLLSNHPDNGFYDLVNYTAVNTLMNGGRAHSVNVREMPLHASMAAIYRY